MDIVLVGGGHAHVEVLRSAAMAPFAGARLTVVARDVLTPYSGMLPGYLAGAYSLTQSHIDLRPLASRASARLIHAPAVGLDPVGRRVILDGRPSVPFDIASLDIGSTPATDGIAGAGLHGVPVKPPRRFLERWEQASRAALESGSSLRVAIVGGGAAGVELGLALQASLAARTGAGEFLLVTDDAVLLPGHGAAAARRLESSLAAAGFRIMKQRRVAALEEEGLVLADGSRVASDLTVLATGAAAAPWLGRTGLLLDGRGFVAVDRRLRSLSHPHVLAAGDTAGFTPRELPKNGVHAVRQGPVLARSLRRLAAGREAVPYRPQRHTMALISTGGGRAVLSRGALALSGRWVWRWKDRIDRRWMERYSDLPAMSGDDAMRCGGCGAKVPARVLERALARLDIPSAPDVVIGLDAADDAAVVRPPEGTVAVHTVDQFPVFLDDPWIFGRIAAVHALSDIHAMGAEPLSAMALVGLAPGAADAMEEDLVWMLSGVLSVLDSERCTLVGGHTCETERASLGLAVTGWSDEASLIRLSGLAPGDDLVLTRPLGTGALFAADMRAEAEGPWIGEAVRAMQRSNGPAARILARHGARAMTDISGFGLAGHLWEMARASGVAVRIDRLPAYPGARRLLAAGRTSTLHPGNVAALSGILDEDGADPLVFDPQTAGGLVAGIPPGRAADVLEELHRAGESGACVIGSVCGSQGPSLEASGTLRRSAFPARA